MKVHKTELSDVLLIEPPTVFEDWRGQYVEIYNDTLYRQNGINYDFIQDDISVSQYRVLRGIHGDGTTAKLVSCLSGKFYLIVINNDPTSSEYRRWTTYTLSDRNRHQVLIPPKFGNGHLVLSEQAIFHYKQTTEYNRSGQFTLAWDDPDLGLWWPMDDPLVSRRDEGVGRRMKASQPSRP